MSSPQKKKIPYKISSDLNTYLNEIGRAHVIPINYDDLLRFTASVNLYDKHGNDTLWQTVVYPHSEMEELNR